MSRHDAAVLGTAGLMALREAQLRRDIAARDARIRSQNEQILDLRRQLARAVNRARKQDEQRHPRADAACALRQVSGGDPSKPMGSS